ncbi:MAG: S8 family peptidase [Candidatus Aminicenantales bacterium]
MRFRTYITLIFIISFGLIGFGLKGPQAQQRERPNPRQGQVFLRDLPELNKGLPFRIQSPRYKEGEVLVKFKPEVTEAKVSALMAIYGTRPLKKIPRIDVHEIEIPKSLSVMETVALLAENPDVEFVEPNWVAQICVTPNDTLFKYQYALYNSGQEIGIPGSPRGKQRADIHASEAWEETRGAKDVVIAIIDSGVDLLHPDIKDKLKSSGRDIVNNDFDATDDLGHGTHVAGIAAAATDNNEGIAGVAWNCQVLPVKVIDKEGSGLYSWLAEAIIWATDNQAAVINLSIGGDEPSDTLKEALRYAYQKGVVIIAATGNDSGPVLYPAAYDDYCLAVAATDYNDTRPEWSNYGSEVDVAAPGVRIVSLVPRWYFGPDSLPYGYGTGTSMAAPHVAGLAALLKSHKPWLKAREIMDIIRYSSDDINATQYPGLDNYLGYGRVNMEKALVPIKIKKAKG